MSDAGKFAGLIGAAAIVAGIVFGMLGLSVVGPEGTFTCGSAFSSNGYSARASVDDFVNGQGYADAAVASCDSKRSDRRTVALILILGGSVVGVGGLMIGREKQSDPAPTV